MLHKLLKIRIRMMRKDHVNQIYLQNQKLMQISKQKYVKENQFEKT